MTSRNPYNPPTSISSHNEPRPPFSHVAAILISVITALVHYGALRASASFAEVFSGFDADLPWLTQLFLQGSPVYYFVPGLCIVAYIGRWAGFRAARPLFIGCAITSILVIPTFIIAMYLPVFQLGAAVGVEP